MLPFHMAAAVFQQVRRFASSLLAQPHRADHHAAFRRLVAEEDELLQQADVAARRRSGRRGLLPFADAAACRATDERAELREHPPRPGVDLVTHGLLVEEQLGDLEADHDIAL
jgi:hypothetical protein